MSTKYQSTKDVPIDAIILRLHELSDAIIAGKPASENELTMRIPAECDRDADLVIGEAAVRLNNQKSLLKDIFNDITKDNRLSPDTFDKLVEVVKDE